MLVVVVDVLVVVVVDVCCCLCHCDVVVGTVVPCSFCVLSVVPCVSVFVACRVLYVVWHRGFHRCVVCAMLVVAYSSCVVCNLSRPLGCVVCVVVSVVVDARVVVRVDVCWRLLLSLWLSALMMRWS